MAYLQRDHIQKTDTIRAMQYKKLDELGEIRKRRGVAYYHQLYTLLSAALNDGLIAAGSALPSESELMERFEVSRNTVRRALGQLEQEKRIVRRRGSGSYARLIPKAEVSNDSIAEIIHDFAAGNSRSASRLVRVQTTKTPEFVRRKDPDFGDQSLLVQRCRTFRDEPFMFSTSYVPAQIGARLTRRQLAQQVVSNALDALGMTPATAEQTTTAILADALTARHLGVELASALLCIHRLIRDDSGGAIEHQSHAFRADLSPLRSQVAIERTASGLRWSDPESVPLPVGL
jgi:GntR family transcriptional regulator